MRQMHFRQGITEIHVDKDTYITPQAMEYIRDKRLVLVSDTEVPQNEAIKPVNAPQYTDLDGNVYAEKPEHMTHLMGNVLVDKSHPRIALRGKLDSLQAEIIMMQSRACDQGLQQLVLDLDELLQLARAILSSEVTDKPLAPLCLFGLDASELRKQSQNPKDKFGINHILPSHTLGWICSSLNSLRAKSREVELAAITAFSNEETTTHDDLICALNRMSSAFYIMMFYDLTGRYVKVGKR